MDDKKEIDSFLASEAWAPETTKKYRLVIDRLKQDIPDQQALSVQQLRAWLDDQGWGSSMQWVGLCAVKKFLSWKYGLTHPALETRIKRIKSPPQRSLNYEQVKTLLTSFDTSSPKGRRDLAMCSLFIESGLRVSEMSRLDLRRLEIDQRSLWVIVKGGEWEKGVFSEYTAAYLAAWLADRERVTKASSRTVFVGIGGNKPGQPMTREGIQTIVRKWGKVAGIGDLSPHDFRRTGATLATKLGAPHKIVKAAFRWHSDEMLDRYTSAIEPEDFAPWFPVKRIMEDL